METGSEDPILNRLALITQSLFEKTLTSRSKEVIMNLAEGRTFSENVKIISESSEASKTSVRRAIQNLRELGIVECGSKKNRGIPLRFTEAGRIITRGYRIMAVLRAPDSETGVQIPLTPLVYKKQKNKGSDKDGKFKSNSL